MKKNSPCFCFLFFFTSLLSIQLKAQPFIDVVNFNSQYFSTAYKDSLHSKNTTLVSNLNSFLPIKFKNGNMLLIRTSAEKINSSIEHNTRSLYSISLPVGFQFVSKSKRWKTLVMVIPKIASDFKADSKKSSQLGGTLLFTYVSNDSLLKFKFGLFYNRECFGNFFVPLLGIDWKATSHLSLYGILPNNMRLEYKTGEKFYFGIGFRNYKRSYRLWNGEHDDFVLVRETQGKFFADYFVWKKIILFADVSYTLRYDFGEYAEDDMKMKTPLLTDPVYSPMKNNFLFTAGLAYRLRLD